MFRVNGRVLPTRCSSPSKKAIVQVGEIGNRRPVVLSSLRMFAPDAQMLVSEDVLQEEEETDILEDVLREEEDIKRCLLLQEQEEIASATLREQEEILMQEEEEEKEEEEEEVVEEDEDEDDEDDDDDEEEEDEDDTLFTYRAARRAAILEASFAFDEIRIQHSDAAADEKKNVVIQAFHQLQEHCSNLILIIRSLSDHVSISQMTKMLFYPNACLDMLEMARGTFDIFYNIRENVHKFLRLVKKDR